MGQQPAGRKEVKRFGKVLNRAEDVRRPLRRINMMTWSPSDDVLDRLQSPQPVPANGTNVRGAGQGK